MEGAIGLIILLLLIVLLLPVLIANGINTRVKELGRQLQSMQALLTDISRQLRENPGAAITPAAPVPVAPEPVAATAVPEPEIIPEPVLAPEPEEIIPEEPAPVETVIPEPVPLPVTEEPVAPLPVPAPVLRQPRVRKDLERFIGERLMSLVGIGILVLGIFFTVKWAIDKQMIGDAGKVLIGILSGTLLIAVAHRIRKAYHTFSSILVGGGLAVLYFSVYIAFQDYHLLSQVPAFIAMVGVTIAAVVLSLLYDRKELAVIALAGGFATPFFVSNNEGNYQVLFSYLLVLNVGMFLLANYKKWHLINLISYIATVIIYLGWMTTQFDAHKGHAAGGLLFATLFYLVFFGMNIIYNLRHRERFGVPEIIMLLSNTFLYYAAGMACLQFIRDGFYQGLFTLLLSVFNFVFAYLFFRRQQTDRNLIYLLIGLVLTFLSLAAPVQLDGNYITLFWAAECVLLYWLGGRSGIKLIRNTSVLVLALALCSLVKDWTEAYQVGYTLPFLFNKVFITGAAVLLAIWLKERMAAKDKELPIGWIIPAEKYPAVLKTLRVLVLYLVLLLELSYQASHRVGVYPLTATWLWSYHYLFAALLFLYVQRRGIPALSRAVAIGLALLLFVYMGAAETGPRLYEQTLGKPPGLYLWHYLLAASALWVVFLLIRYVMRHYTVKDKVYTFGAWFCTGVTLLILSTEAINTWTGIAGHGSPAFYGDHIRAAKIALPILWSLCSLVLMLCGMRYRIRTFRIISLTLFTLTIAKLFVYDISGVGQGGRIAAFICLGIILLVVSFLYQKIKGLFIDDDRAATENKTE